MAYGEERLLTNSLEDINMKSESIKHRLISKLFVLRTLLMNSAEAPLAKRHYQEEYTQKSAELVCLEIEVYRKKYKL